MKETSWQDLCNRSLRNVSVQDLHIRGVLARFLYKIFFPKNVATLGVLTVRAKAWCSFEVVSGMGGKLNKFDDPCSTNTPSSSLFDGRVGSLLLWRGANFEIVRASFLALWACQIALAAARCEFWDRSRNPLGTLDVSDRSRCGAVLICIVKEILRRDLDKEVFCRELTQRSWQDVSCRDLVQRHCIEICWNLAKRSLTEILPTELL